MIISFEEFCARKFDFVGTWVEFIVGYASYDEFLNNNDDVQDCIDSYGPMGCKEVCVISE